MNKLKYLGYSIVFQEVPDEVTLAINISGCPHRCEGCHSEYLWEYEGNYLSDDLGNLIEKYKGLITCVCFMGGDQNQADLHRCIYQVKDSGLKVAIYTGLDNVMRLGSGLIEKSDYIKYGRFDKNLGGLDSPQTNQKMIKFNHITSQWEDITYRFQKGYHNG